MSFLKIVPKEHACRFPDSSVYGEYTEWQCDTCGKIYRLIDTSYYSVRPDAQKTGACVWVCISK